ncbi:transcription termination factor Rho [Pseudobutyrivibrio sp.]|uniref:transcription termination factor Rho n=1 Tax=Pseudobutyrivibrio sp. TaxID=2014367 RepID=UPI001D5FE024|nr:transcription termination factor Rho [Pseudobutyrivibrio sp.]MBE5911532.1 transcription termination factor Rho [Pseudobutyrivibrio sp.]
MREKYESLAVTVLRDLAKARGIKGASSMKKAELVEAMLAQDEIDAANANTEKAEKAENTEKTEKAERTRTVRRTKTSESAHATAEKQERPEKVDRAHEEKREIPTDIPTDGLIPASGILEVMGDGFGFIRCDNYMPGTEDVYVSQSQIKKFNLKTGDIIVGKKRFNNPTDKFAALMIIDTINNYSPEAATKRPNFEDLTPIFPNERIRLERQRSSVAMRIVDLVSPIGKGQRGMIVSQPKAGKTTLLKEVATSVNYSHPDMHLIILLIDERPEEVTDMKDTMRNSKNVEVIYSTFDESPEHHKRVSEMVIERAKRLVEHGQDVMILLDSITRLARAYNLTVQPSGRTLSGGLDPAALHMPKKFFGAARNMREGGSLTILATALVETGSKMDDVVFEEFKGTGNMELILDRKLSEKRIFPAVDITGSGTRREDLLLSQKELDAMEIMRKAINGARREDAVETILNMFAHTKSNDEYIDMIIRKRVI